MFRHAVFITVAVLGAVSLSAEVPREKDFEGYLFTYFTSTGNTGTEEAIRFAVSDDGYNFHALNGNYPVISSADISQT